ncbi:MAG: hypothetical protein ACP5KS_01185 [Candidatus Hydrogenedens sp.]
MRKMIKELKKPMTAFTKRLHLSTRTIWKWKKREDLRDKSSRPHKLQTMFYLKYDHSAKSAKAFLDEVRAVCPYPIYTVLPENGKEFTDRFCRGRKTTIQ